jgi:hypothetical protein
MTRNAKLDSHFYYYCCGRCCCALANSLRCFARASAQARRRNRGPYLRSLGLQRNVTTTLCAKITARKLPVQSEYRTPINTKAFELDGTGCTMHLSQCMHARNVVSADLNPKLSNVDLWCNRFVFCSLSINQMVGGGVARVAGWLATCDVRACGLVVVSWLHSAPSHATSPLPLSSNFCWVIPNGRIAFRTCFRTILRRNINHASTQGSI